MKNYGLIGCGIMCASLSVAQNQRPNVVLILADDMRATTLECFGVEETQTPQLNQFSKDCTLFTNAHIMGGTSGAVSMPSRAMIMSGKYLYDLKKEGGFIPESHTTIGEVMQKGGYNTFHIGKWHNDKAAFNRCFNDGDDLFFGGMSDHWNVPLYHYDKSGKYADSRPEIKDFLKNNNVKMLRGEYMHSGQHSVDIFTDTAVDFINREAGDSKPFFLSLCYMSPHDPRSMPQEFMDKFDPQQVKLPANFMLRHPFDNGDLGDRDELLAKLPREEGEVKRHIADYYAMINHLDQRVGDVVAALKKSGQYDNTIIIFAADNGLALGQHGLMGKQNVYEHSVRVPLMIKLPNQKQTVAKTDKLCYLIDLFPTICELTGQSVPASVDGVSLMPILESDKTVRDYLYYGFKTLQRAVSDGEWKLIEYRVKGVATTQLFNLKNDLMEQVDLSKDKKYAKVMTSLKKQMQIQKELTHDTAVF